MWLYRYIAIGLNGDGAIGMHAYLFIGLCDSGLVVVWLLGNVAMWLLDYTDQEYGIWAVWLLGFVAVGRYGCQVTFQSRSK